jgi:hypothetical protein
MLERNTAAVAVQVDPVAFARERFPARIVTCIRARDM